ncbi:MAG: hypothetical protein HUJ25_03640 [Crocinitomicaceae bacterium]|nr:hypothetical protein [Crocinitomicaceae bacterium]
MKKVSLIAFIFLLCSFSLQAQEKKKITAMFEGYDGVSYSFSYGDEEYIFFDECADNVLKEFDLSSDEFMYEDFVVTYVVSKNEDEDETYKIVDLLHVKTDEE